MLKTQIIYRRNPYKNEEYLKGIKYSLEQYLKRYVKIIRKIMLHRSWSKRLLEERFNEEMQIKDSIREKSIKIIIETAVKVVWSHGNHLRAMQKTCKRQSIRLQPNQQPYQQWRLLSHQSTNIIKDIKNITKI